MVLQKVVVEGQLEVTDTLIDDNNSAIQVGHWGSFLDPCVRWICGNRDIAVPSLALIPLLVV